MPPIAELFAAAGIFVVFQLGLAILGFHAPSPIMYGLYLLGIALVILGKAALGAVLDTSFRDLSLVQWIILGCFFAFGATAGQYATEVMARLTVMMPKEAILVSHVTPVVVVPALLCVLYAAWPMAFPERSLDAVQIGAGLMALVCLYVFLFGKEAFDTLRQPLVYGLALLGAAAHYARIRLRLGTAPARQPAHRIAG